MVDYSNKEENYDWKRAMLLQDLRPANFAEFCGTFHISQLEDEVKKLIDDIMNKSFSEQFESQRTYFIDFLKRATKAIKNNNLDDIHTDEEKYVLFAKETIMK